MTMRPYIDNITRSASFALKKISSIRKYLDRQSCEKLVHAFISSRLDNCNSLLINLPNKDLRKLPHIQNSSARLVALSLKKKKKTGSHHPNLVWPPLAACHSPHKLQSSSAYILNSLRYGTCLHVCYTSLCSCKDTKIQLQQSPSDAICYDNYLRGESLLNQGSKTMEFSAAKHQASWIGWSLQGTLKTISVQTGIWLVTHSFNVFCFPLITFVSFMYLLCCSLSYSLALYVLCLLRIEMSVCDIFAPYKHRVLL